MPRPKITKERYCTMEWCDRKLYSRGLCKPCYEKDRRGTLVDPSLPREEKVCSFDGCDRPFRTKGYCQSHYMQLWNGKEVTALLVRKEVPERPGERYCKSCDQWKDREEGFFNASTAGCKQNECKVCQVKRNSINQERRKLKKMGLFIE